MKDGRGENEFTSSLESLSATGIFRNIRYHAAIENGFAIRSTVVDTIPTGDGLVQVESDLFGNASHLWQFLLQPWRLVPIAWGGNQRGNNLTVAIADSDNFIVLKVFVPAESEIITAFLRHCHCPIPMNNADVEELFLVKMRHGTREDGIEAPLGLISA